MGTGATTSPDAFSAVSSFIQQVSADVQAIQKIANILNTARSCTIEVDNNTKLTLKIKAKSTSHGKFIAPLPLDQINPQSPDVYGAESDAGSVWTGTEGVVTYMNDTFGNIPLEVNCHFDNPYYGNNSADITMSGNTNPLFTSVATAGAGDTKAPMRFEISHNVGKFHIRNRATGKVLDVPGKSHDPQTAIQQYDPNEGLNQQWRFAPVDGKYYIIYNEESAQVLNIAGGSLNTGFGIVQQFPLNAPNTNRDNQMWQLIPRNIVPIFGTVIGPYFTIRNKATNMVLDVPNGDRTTNQIQQYREKADSEQPENQEWYFDPI